MKIEINSVSPVYAQAPFSEIPIGTPFVWILCDESQPNRCGGAAGLKMSATEWLRFDDMSVIRRAASDTHPAFLLTIDKISFNPVLRPS